MSTSMSSQDREEERSALTYLTCYMQYIHRQPFTGHHHTLMRYIRYKNAQLLESCYLIPSVIVCIVAYRCCWQSRGGSVLSLCPPYESVCIRWAMLICDNMPWEASGRNMERRPVGKSNESVLCNNKMNDLLSTSMHVLLKPSTTSDHCWRNEKRKRANSYFHPR